MSDININIISDPALGDVYINYLSEWRLAGGISAANCIAAYQPKGAANLAASYIKLNNPGTYDATPVVAPTWDAVNGWIFNGSTQYMTTGIVPATTWSMILKFTDSGVQLDTYWGAFAGLADRFDFCSRNGAAAHRYNIGDKPLTTGAPVVSGTMALASVNCYLNGAADGVIAAGGATTGQLNLGILGAGIAYFKGYVQAFAVYNITLLSAQILEL